MRPIIGIAADCVARPEDNRGLALADSRIQFVDDDYIRAVERAGGAPVIVPVTEIAIHSTPLIGLLDGILFIGGSDIDPKYYGEAPDARLGKINPIRDAHEFALIDHVLQHTRLPVLAICRGCQLLNAASGGKLVQDLPTGKPGSRKHGYAGESPKHIAVHNVSLREDSRLMAIYGEEEIPVNSFHHQAVEIAGADIDAVAFASDGTIEGIEKKGERFVVGVQWHPEMMHEYDERSSRLFRSFVMECAKRA